jgi:hypothetical protein
MLVQLFELGANAPTTAQSHSFVVQLDCPGTATQGAQASSALH